MCIREQQISILIRNHPILEDMFLFFREETIFGFVQVLVAAKVKQMV